MTPKEYCHRWQPTNKACVRQVASEDNNKQKNEHKHDSNIFNRLYHFYLKALNTITISNLDNNLLSQTLSLKQCTHSGADDKFQSYNGAVNSIMPYKSDLIPPYSGTKQWVSQPFIFYVPLAWFHYERN